jgi:hypothetical protein
MGGDHLPDALLPELLAGCVFRFHNPVGVEH